MNYLTDIDSRSRCPGRLGRGAALLLGVLALAPAAWGAGYIVQPQFANRWADTTTNVVWLSDFVQGSATNYLGTCPFGVTAESSGTNGAAVTQPFALTNTPYRLTGATFGQPIESLKPDFDLGDVIVPPVGADPSRAPVIFPSTAAFYVPSRGRVIAADYGSVRIDWVKLDGTTVVSRVYQISAVPAKEPARLFWTEPPYNSPAVDLSGKFVVVHTNAAVRLGSLTVVSNDYGGTAFVVENGIRVTENGAQKEIRAGVGITGTFILEYFETGSYEQHVGIEIVEVMPPQILRQSVALGVRLRPVNNQWDVNGLIAQVTTGQTEQRVYRHTTAAGNSDQENWLFAVTPSVEKPWNIEVYWKHLGILSVEWPYEVDWYEADWPAKRQLYVRDATLPGGGPKVLIPGEFQVGLPGFLNPVVYQAPAAHARFAGDNLSFTTDGAGKALLAFQAFDVVWFQAVESLDHADTNCFDSATNDWAIASEVTYSNAVYGAAWMDFPGYIWPHGGDNYNAHYYNYPTPDNPDAESHVYAVNHSDETLEVWWANPLLQSAPVAMPAPIYFPSMVKRYHAVWPTNATALPIAGNNSNPEKMLTATKYANPQVYVQNDKAQAGYNPNEEHAVIDAGAVYPIRTDLNVTNGAGYSSDPYVLVEYDDGEREGRPDMRAFRVVLTNEAYPRLESALVAGTLIQPPLPFTKMPKSMLSSNDVVMGDQAWRDRNLDYWAKAAGYDGASTANIVMRYYYPMQASFCFPGLQQQPSPGTELPWLPDEGPDAVSKGTPIIYTYTVRWPDNAPTLKLVDTLYKARNGLPDLSNQKSVSILFDQSVANGGSRSVVLIDPTVVQTNGLSAAEWPEIWDQLKAKAQKNPFDGNWYFPELPPHLNRRLYHNPSAAAGSQLRFRGQFVDMLTGDDYLLLNRLSETNRVWVKALIPEGAPSKSAWEGLVDTLAPDIVEVEVGETTNTLTNAAGQTETVYYEYSQPADSFALSTAPAGGTGYVTIAINNCTNLVDPADPISLYVLRVVPDIAQGSLVAVAPDNPFLEKITMRQTLDYGGEPDPYEFQWQRKTSREDPDPADSDFWTKQEGLDELTIGGPGLLTLQDNYFRVRFRSTKDDFPLGTDTWSQWTDWQLAEGWIKRVLKGIDPFEQRIKDLLNSPVYSIVSMIQQAGGRWEGDVPMNLEDVNQYGLIEIYETVLNRGRMLSINAGFNDRAANQALLLAASRLNELYMLLGNEAYADAIDPTIAFGTDDIGYGAEATSLFCFMNQTPTLLDEELALLRGRDCADSTATPWDQAPLYNRLAWNFTRSITGGEVAYALNYGITDQLTEDTNGDNVSDAPDGILDETDAAKMYPQGHGDAWGHYVSAIKGYYTLLHHPNYTWEPLSEDVSLGGSLMVRVDFTDEQKFVASAAAKARTGLEVVKRTHRALYGQQPDTSRVGSLYQDLNEDRAWSAAEWGCRAGLGAYCDWLTGNSLLPYEDANPEHAGVEVIDRRTVIELSEVAATCAAIQKQIDMVDARLNPLGLSDHAVPFDISPAEIDVGKTHFEQICERAEEALNNAVHVFDYAQGCTLKLRQQAESQEQFEDALTSNEYDYNQRLIEIYGYPYGEDIGPGKTYPQGYVGPDLYHFQYIALDGLLDPDAPVAGTNIVVDITTYQGFELDAETCTLLNPFLPPYTNLTVSVSLPSLTTKSITYSVGTDGLIRTPEGWGQRRACGQLQLAYRQFIQTYLKLQSTIVENRALIEELESCATLLYGTITSDNSGSVRLGKLQEAAGRLHGEVALLKKGASALESSAKYSLEGAKAIAQGLPLSNGTANDLTSAGRGGTIGAAVLIAALSEGGAIGLSYQVTQSEEDLLLNEWWRENYAISQLAEQDQHQQWVHLADVRAKLATAQLAIREELNDLAGKMEEYGRLIAEGERLQVERFQGRVQASAHIQKVRYNDMAFRLFRNEALQKYNAAFDLAARYVYLAAKAYDYETALLNSDQAGTPGSVFMAQIARTRALGRVINGEPQPGGASGDPGLADVLYRLKANWEVLNGRLGFNNPDTETSRFSLRTECQRITALPESDATWQRFLWSCRVDNLNAVPEFRRYCLPFGEEDDIEPGLVIPFSTMVNFGRNFFGYPLAGGDNAYDASHFATKIRSVGVWFSNYNAGGALLANEPRVYLIPIGQDVMRSPSGSLGELRMWSVEDQAIPIPYPIGDTDLDRSDWYAMDDTLGGGFAQLRKYASLRAYHDSGTFDPSQTCNNSRLVGRSVWNTKWALIIPAGTLHVAREQALHDFIDGPDGTNGVSDIKLFFQTYSTAGN